MLKSTDEYCLTRETTATEGILERQAHEQGMSTPRYTAQKGLLPNSTLEKLG